MKNLANLGTTIKSNTGHFHGVPTFFNKTIAFEKNYMLTWISVEKGHQFMGVNEEKHGISKKGDGAKPWL